MDIITSPLCQVVACECLQHSTRISSNSLQNVQTPPPFFSVSWNLELTSLKYYQRQRAAIINKELNKNSKISIPSLNRTFLNASDQFCRTFFFFFSFKEKKCSRHNFVLSKNESLLDFFYNKNSLQFNINLNFISIKGRFGR